MKTFKRIVKRVVAVAVLSSPAVVMAAVGIIAVPVVVATVAVMWWIV